jgi:hypothetical protein
MICSAVPADSKLLWSIGDSRAPIAHYLVHCENILDLRLKRLHQCKTIIDL